MLLHDVLTAIRHGTTVAAAEGTLLVSQRRAASAIARRNCASCSPPRRMPSRGRCEIADRCTFSLDELRYEYPEELAPAGPDAAGVSHAAHLGRARPSAIRTAFPDKVAAADRARTAADRRAALRGVFSHRLGPGALRPRRGTFLCQGRGSAANSAVCYCLGVTSVDPDRIDVLFERFISRERNEAPDIDVDFEHERREEVLQYVYDKYGRERAGMTAR